ncbi:TolC family protein [Photobacterium leiognathi]|uniref:TolC family protein n=1 Tax=Photobacterium leiognathi TaxID=553611 RepID=UPI001EE0E19E|nr:TolC family protein [Photobacterium leiognathi]MCG3883709.1 TolC family protein [Photobacterium leiognathi]
MKNNKCIFVLTALITSCSADAVDLSAIDAYSLASENSSVLMAAKLRIGSSELKVDAAKDLYLPNIRLTGNYGNFNVNDFNFNSLGNISSDMPIAPYGYQDLSRKDSLGVSVKTTNLAVSGLWPVYTGGKRNAVINIAELENADAHLDYLITESRLYENFIQKYYAVVLLNNHHLSAKHTTKNLKHHVETSLKLYAQGLISELDVLKIKTAYEKAKTVEYKSEGRLEVGTRQLRELVKADIHPIDGLDDNNPELGELDLVIENVLSNNLNLRKIIIKKKELQEFINYRKGDFLPGVYLAGSKSYIILTI